MKVGFQLTRIFFVHIMYAYYSDVRGNVIANNDLVGFIVTTQKISLTHASLFVGLCELLINNPYSIA